jgi:hypothetical protein
MEGDARTDEGDDVHRIRINRGSGDVRIPEAACSLKGNKAVEVRELADGHAGAGLRKGCDVQVQNNAAGG